MAVSFMGGETTGGVADKQVETAKKETTGGVGVRKQQESIFAVDNEPKCDTVCFKGREYSGGSEKKSSTINYILGLSALTAITVGLLGLAHKHNAVSKISNEKIKDFLKNSEKITEPCYRACKWVKNNSYDKAVSYFKTK